MTRPGPTSILAGLLLALACSSQAQERPRFSLEGWYWNGTLSAKAQVSDGTLGTLFDFKRDLGLTDKGIGEGRFVFAVGPHSFLRLTHLAVTYQGDASVSRTIEFGGTTYTVGTRVLTDLEQQYTRLGWVWQFVGAADGAFRFGTVLEAKRLKIDASLAAPELEPPVREHDGFDTVLPTIGIAVDVVPHRIVDLFLEASGIDAGSHGSMYDAEAGVRLYPIRNLGLMASYRILDLHVDQRRDYARLRIEGPFLGLSARW